MPQPHSEIQFQPAPQARPPAQTQPTTLLATMDPNEATVAFHAALSRLRAHGEVGHLLMQKLNGERELLLRQPVEQVTVPDEDGERRR